MIYGSALVSSVKALPVSNGMDNCIFCSIAKGEQRADIVMSGDDCVAFKSIDPKAPVHVIIIPRKHIASVTDMEETDELLMGKLINCAKNIAVKLGIADTGYRLAVNVGRGGGQIIFHVHLHLLGGWEGKPSSTAFV